MDAKTGELPASRLIGKIVILEVSALDNQKLIEKTNEITDRLEHEASKKLNEAQAYHKGYVQACEDFGRAIRLEVYGQN